MTVQWPQVGAAAQAIRNSTAELTFCTLRFGGKGGRVIVSRLAGEWSVCACVDCVSVCLCVVSVKDIYCKCLHSAMGREARLQAQEREAQQAPASIRINI